MLVLGYCKLTSKKGLPMAKVQCVRDYTPEELLDKVTPACISKEMLTAWQNVNY